MFQKFGIDEKSVWNDEVIMAASGTLNWLVIPFRPVLNVVVTEIPQFWKAEVTIREA